MSVVAVRSSLTVVNMKRTCMALYLGSERRIKSVFPSINVSKILICKYVLWTCTSFCSVWVSLSTSWMFILSADTKCCLDACWLLCSISKFSPLNKIPVQGAILQQDTHTSTLYTLYFTCTMPLEFKGNHACGHSSNSQHCGRTADQSSVLSRRSMGAKRHTDVILWHAPEATRSVFPYTLSSILPPGHITTLSASPTNPYSALRALQGEVVLIDIDGGARTHVNHACVEKARSPKGSPDVQTLLIECIGQLSVALCKTITNSVSRIPGSDAVRTSDDTKICTSVKCVRESM